MIDAAQFLRPRMHMHQLHLRLRDFEQRVALRRISLMRPPSRTTKSAPFTRASNFGLGAMPRSPA